jgi:hypothetical protein
MRDLRKKKMMMMMKFVLEKVKGEFKEWMK